MLLVLVLVLVLVMTKGLFDDAANEQVILASSLELTSRGSVASTSSVVVAALIILMGDNTKIQKYVKHNRLNQY